MRGINVYTAPQNFIKAGCPRTPQVFEQIIGIQTDSGERLWSNYVSPGDTGPQPNPVDAQETILPLNEHQAAKLLQFFNDWFVHERAPTFKVNCHWFMRWMTGVHAGQVDETPVIDVLRHGVRSTTLAVGQAGILGYRMNGSSIAMHSLLGLGTENPKCLQVMAMDGYLATADYGTVYEYNTEVAGIGIEQAEKTGYDLFTLPLAA